MIANRQLHRIRTGEATAKEARAIIRDMVAALEPVSHEALYGALRGWTWKAMQTRRFDDEMSDWFQVINAASAALARSDTKVSHFLLVLSHLVDDSLRYAATHHTEQLLNRSHLGEILEIVARYNGRIGRDRLAEATNLADSRLSQLLSELTIAGALERQKEGRQARFILTDTGRELLENWRALRRAMPEPNEQDLFDELEEQEAWQPRDEVLTSPPRDGNETDWSAIEKLSGLIATNWREANPEALAVISRTHFESETSEEPWPGFNEIAGKREKELSDA